MSYTLDELKNDPSLIFKASKVKNLPPLDLTGKVDVEKISEGHYLCELHHLNDTMNPNCSNVAEVEYRIVVAKYGIKDNMYVCKEHHWLIRQNTRPNIARIKARKEWQRKKGIESHFNEIAK